MKRLTGILVVLVILFSGRTRADDNPFKFVRERFVGRKPGFTTEVDLKSRFKEGRAWVSWGSKSWRHGEYLRFPRKWWPMPRDWFEGLPPVFFWDVGKRWPLLIVLTSPDYISGSWEYAVPLVFELRREHWRRLRGGVGEFDLSSTGGFFVRGRRMYVFDIDCNDNYGHMDDHRYRLTEYQYSPGRLRRIRSRLTKKRYRPTGWEGGVSIRHDDPLREFGLRWRWGAAFEGEPKRLPRTVTQSKVVPSRPG